MSSWASQAHAFPHMKCSMWNAVLTAPLERSTCPYQWSLLSFRIRSRSSMPSCASSSLDLVLTMSCGLKLQICLIIACRSAADVGDLVLSMAKSHWHGALRSAHKSCTHSHVSWKKGEDRTGSSSLNFFQVFFTRVVVESSQPPAAKSMSPRLQKEATPSSLSGLTWTSLYGLPSKGLAVPWLCVHL